MSSLYQIHIEFSGRGIQFVIPLTSTMPGVIMEVDHFTVLTLVLGTCPDSSFYSKLLRKPTAESFTSKT